ncbi:MAG: sodium:solute symporter family protein [Candidatus Zixiibacteriota bacterium]
MSTIDYIIIFIYLLALIYVGFTRRSGKTESVAGFILGGRTLTLPAFVATLVSSWYGGILGVGEYSFKFGISNWLVFGVPYYLAAFLFAIFLAKKARESELLTIPDRLDKVYGKKTAVLGSIILFFTTVPGAYILMLAVLIKFLFGWELYQGAIVGTIFSLFYVYLGGFRSVVRTDIFQFGLMFIGFFILLITLFANYGGPSFIKASVPATHLTWHGGNEGAYIAVWYIIALATLTEPAFYQRCYAAKTEATAKKGILISILFWIFFDFMTTSCGLYARALLPNLSEPIASFPALAQLVLPAGLLGIFALALLATIMSTVDSYSFLAASTFGRDIVWRLFKIDESKINFFTRIGLIISAVLAVVVALWFESVVKIWHDFGSVVTPALLIPLFFAFVGKKRMSASSAFYSIIFSGLVSLIWLILCNECADGDYLYGIPAIVPGLIVSIIFFLTSRKSLEITA